LVPPLPRFASAPKELSEAKIEVLVKPLYLPVWDAEDVTFETALQLYLFAIKQGSNASYGLCNPCGEGAELFGTVRDDKFGSGRGGRRP